MLSAKKGPSLQKHRASFSKGEDKTERLVRLLGNLEANPFSAPLRKLKIPLQIDIRQGKRSRSGNVFNPGGGGEDAKRWFT